MTYLNYLTPFLLVNHRSSTMLLQRTFFSTSLQAFLEGSSISRSSKASRPYWFHFRDCLVTLAAGFRRVCPNQPHFLFLIWTSFLL